MNQKLKKINKQLNNVKIFLLMLTMVLTIYTNQVYAASDPIAVVNNLSDFSLYWQGGERNYGKE